MRCDAGPQYHFDEVVSDAAASVCCVVDAQVLVEMRMARRYEQRHGDHDDHDEALLALEEDAQRIVEDDQRLHHAEVENAQEEQRVDSTETRAGYAN